MADQNKNILIIGSSGGIGNKVAEMLLNEGFKVFGTYFQHPENVKNLKKSENFSDYFVDIREIKELKKLKNSLQAEAPSLYAIVNCSGIVDYEGESLEKDFKIWEDTIATNLSGNYYLAKVFQGLLVENGRFIMISSTDAQFGGAITAGYAASKAGVDSLTKSLSLLFQDKKVLVNSISPGWVVTPMIEINGDEFMDKVAEINPLKRNAYPEDVGNLIKFLLSEEASYINGQVISLEGGYTNQDPTLLLEEEVQEEK
jgi:NAD(P)-dependent dehydrogenase (short-subunit alcohol dehydrogenase family)